MHQSRTEVCLCHAVKGQVRALGPACCNFGSAACRYDIACSTAKNIGIGLLRVVKQETTEVHWMMPMLPGYSRVCGENRSALKKKKKKKKLG